MTYSSKREYSSLNNEQIVQRSYSGLPILVFVLSLILTAAATYYSNQLEANRVREHFAFSTTQVVDAVKGRMLEYEQVLRGGVGLYRVSPSVSRKQWHDYVTNNEMSVHYPGIQNMAISVPVSAGQKQRHIDTVRAEGFPRYTIHPEQPKRPIYHSLVYVEPFSGRNLRAFGFDMYTNSVRRAAMDRAIDQGLPSVSGMVKLAQETNEDVQQGFIYCLPVYRSEKFLETPVQRRAALRALVCGGFRVNDLMKGIFGSNTSDMELEIFDNGDIRQDSLMYTSNREAGVHQASLSSIVPIQVGGRNWSLRISANRNFTASVSSYQTVVVAVAGLLLNLSLFAALYILGGRERRAHQLAEEMTRSLFDTESKYSDIVSSASDAILSKNLDGTITSWNSSAERMFGYPASEAVGNSALCLLPAEYQVTSPLNMHRLMNGEHIENREEVRVRKDGSPMEVSVTYSPMRNHEGRVYGISEVISDITQRKRAEEALKLREERFQTLFDRAVDGILILTPNGDFVSCNKSFADMHGYTTREMLALNIGDLDTPASSRLMPERMRRIMAGESLTFEVENCRKDGSVFPMEVSASLIIVDGENLIQSFSRDITERKISEKNLRVLAAAFETHEAILITDTDANIIKVNQAFQNITGYRADEVIGKNPNILSAGRLDNEFYADMWRQLLSDGKWSGEVWDKRKSGQIYPKWLTISAIKDDAGKTTEYVGIFKDITARKKADDEIHNLAFYDALTRLPNRRLLMDRLRSALSSSARSHHYGAVLFLDLDKFKTINDTLGHDYGDQLLVEVSMRIQSCVREADTVARLGGDEFVILLEEIDDHAENASLKVAQIAEKIRTSLTMPYQLKGNEYHSSTSIGVSLYRGNEESVEVLLKQADMAMYQAKDSGRNAVCFFNPMMQILVETRAALEVDLRQAIFNQQLHLYYQIQVGNDQRPIGAEALVRWHHPVRGIVSPAQFIPIAEESNLILDVGNWVLDTACRQLAEWTKSTQARDLLLAVNISAKQFQQDDFVENVASILRSHGVEASRLKLELTESVVLNDVTDVVAKMHALKALGVNLSMDDFGTGYSSLSYLKRLPLDQIKIDQSFVRDIVTDQNDAIMVKTIIDLARNFRLNVIAEGVETEAQLDFLQKNGCMAYQGYYFSKPVPIDEFDTLLVSN